MVQFDILSGKKAGTHILARHFPFHVGRAPGNALLLDDDGIWDRHCTLEFDRQKGFTLTTAPRALVTVNGDPVETAILRSGDVVTAGSAKLQFWLTAVPQRGLQIREALVWMLLAAVTVIQFVLIYRLLR